MTEKKKLYRAAVIGHTGQGNYGHGLDIAFCDLPMIEIVAVADPVEAGRLKAQARMGAPRAYADYQSLLAQERPDLVAIAPRWLGERVAMVTAAAAAGAHIFLEKPLASTLAEADVMVDACAKAGVKMVVAHQGRLHPATLHAQQLVQAGEIGRLRQVRGYGKMDHRGGGQDLMVLGTHVLDLMRLYAGNASWVSAELLVGSRLATAADVRQGDEGIGPLAGDGLRATFGFKNDVVGFFESFAGLGMGEEYFGLDLVGEQGQLSLRGGFNKRLMRYPRPYTVPGAPHTYRRDVYANRPDRDSQPVGAAPDEYTDYWSLITVPGTVAGETPGTAAASSEALVQHCNRRLVLDLLAAIEEDRAPLSSGERARAALELIQAIAAAHAAGGRITLPLQERHHPLS
ncbi:MAG: Gfo/Idh/MocA family oxidoreductase [Caldilineaceae bacterium]